jgi:REP element-mobilizing transposase RayT
MSNPVATKARWRARLPHWEVAGHWHFITIRCHGSLPPSAQEKIRQIHASLQRIEANDPAFSQLQRQYLLTTEKYLDQGTGFAPFTDSPICRDVLSALDKMTGEGWEVGEAVIMPNHVHLLTIQTDSVGLSLKKALERFKGRSARTLNARLQRKGRFWQEDWFDRWMRNEDEKAKTIRYIRNNPVKARLAAKWQDYPWRISNFPG